MERRGWRLLPCPMGQKPSFCLISVVVLPDGSLAPRLKPDCLLLSTATIVHGCVVARRKPGASLPTRGKRGAKAALSARTLDPPVPAATLPALPLTPPRGRVHRLPPRGAGAALGAGSGGARAELRGPGRHRIPDPPQGPRPAAGSRPTRPPHADRTAAGGISGGQGGGAWGIPRPMYM